MDETPFRILLLVLLSAFGATWVRSFILGGLDRAAFYTPLEGFVAGLLLRLSLTVGVVGILLYLASSRSMGWSQLGLPGWLRVAGFPVGVLSFALLRSALDTLGRDFSATLRTKPAQALVTTGPYRFVRHPMYVALVGLWLAYSCLSSNWLIAGAGTLAYGVVLVRRVPREERMMLERFGSAYAAYVTQTGRFCPRRGSGVR